MSGSEITIPNDVSLLCQMREERAKGRERMETSYLFVVILSLFPIGPGTVIAVNTRTPLAISHLWPVVFIETRSIGERLSISVEDKRLLCGRQSQHFPRDGKELIAKSQKASKGQNGVCNAS